MDIAVNVDDQGLWSKRNQRLERLKENSRRFHNADQTTDKTMDSELYQSAKTGNVDAFIDVLEQVSSRKHLSLSTIFTKQLTPSGNSLLHVAASYGSEGITQLVAVQFPEPDFISKKNLHGDTALHSAARAGKLSTVKLLLGHGVDTSTRNDDIENTALHYAVVQRHHEVVEELLKRDPRVLCQTNHERESPLYLAVKDGDERMVDILLNAIPEDSDLFIQPEGKSLIHAAIYDKKLAILKKIAYRMPKLLTVDDEKFGSPIHFASSIGFPGGVCFLLDTLGDSALKKNQDGLYPIHVAAQKGHVRVVMEFAKKCSYPLEFLNAKKQNILHVAAENGRYSVVWYILKRIAQPEDVNVQDVEGNTPLHLAAKNGHYMVVFHLVRDERVNRKAVNSINLTPYGVAENQYNVEVDEHEKSDGKEKLADEDIENNGTSEQPNEKLDYYKVMLALSILYFYASPGKSLPKNSGIQSKPLTKEELKSRIENLLIVAVLVAGVTFACAVTLPGVESKNATSPNNNTGTAAKYPIEIYGFVFLDLVAFSWSVMASLVLCSAQLYDAKLASHAVWLASNWIRGGLYWMFAAFFYAAISLARTNVVFAYFMGLGFLFFLYHIAHLVRLIVPGTQYTIMEATPFLNLPNFVFYFMYEWLVGVIYNFKYELLLIQKFPGYVLRHR